MKRSALSKGINECCRKMLSRGISRYVRVAPSEGFSYARGLFRADSLFCTGKDRCATITSARVINKAARMLRSRGIERYVKVIFTGGLRFCYVGVLVRGDGGSGSKIKKCFS